MFTKNCFVYMTLRHHISRLIRSHAAAFCAVSMCVFQLGVAEEPLPSYDVRIAERGYEKELRLREAIELALASNLDVQIEAISPLIESQKTLQAEAEFEPAFEAQAKYETIDTPQSSQEFVSSGGTRFQQGQLLGRNRIFAEDNFESKAGIVGKLPWGTTYDIGFRANRFTNNLTRDPTVALFTPEYRTFTGLNFTQPLLRNFGREPNMSRIQVSKKDKLIADQKFRESLSAIIRETVSAYFDSFLAYEELKVRRFEMEMIRSLAEEKRDQLERGTATERDLAVLRSGLAEAYERFLLARQTLLTKNGDLLLLIHSDFDFNRHPVFLPVDLPSSAIPSGSPEALTSRAMKARPAYLMAIEEVEKMGIILKFQENQLLPRLDFEATIGYSGLAGNFGDAFKQTADGTGHEYGMGLTFNMPLGNQLAKSQLEEAYQSKRQAVLRVKQEEMQTQLLINRHLNAVTTHQKRLRAARATTRMQLQNLQIARENLERGTITPAAVVQVEHDIREARLRESSAAADIQKAAIDLRDTCGILLGHYQIEVGDATEQQPAVVNPDEVAVLAEPLQLAEPTPVAEETVMIADATDEETASEGFPSFLRTVFGKSRVETASAQLAEGSEGAEEPIFAAEVSLKNSADRDEPATIVAQPVLTEQPVRKPLLNLLQDRLKTKQ